MFIASCLAFGQEVKLKKGIVYEDDIEILKYKTQGNQTTYFTKEGNKIFYIDFIPNHAQADRSYFKIGFYDNDEIITIKNTIERKRIIQNLINEDVIKDGIYNGQKVYDFSKRYDQKLEDRIIRIK
jgi:hypothetical protein